MKSDLTKKQLIKLAQGITAVISDVDGVLNDNRILEGTPFKPKFRSYYDGQGIHLLRHIGVPVCLITGEHGARAKSIVDMVKKWNAPFSPFKKHGNNKWHRVTLYTGVGGTEKVRIAECWLKNMGMSFSTCVHMADDILDIPLLKKVAMRAAPAQAEDIIKNMAHFVSKREGGSGAFRDLANFILESKGFDISKLPFQ